MQAYSYNMLSWTMYLGPSDWCWVSWAATYLCQELGQLHKGFWCFFWFNQLSWSCWLEDKECRHQCEEPGTWWAMQELCSILLCWYTKQCILYRVKGLHMYKLCSIAVLLHMLSNTVFQTNTIKGEFSVVIATTFSLRLKQQSRVALAAAVVELQNIQNMIKYRNFYTCPGSVWSQLCFQCNRCPWGGTISCKQWWPCYTQRAEHHWLFR